MSKNAPPKPVADEPVGTPPAGGSWQWRDGAWHRQPATPAPVQPSE